MSHQPSRYLTDSEFQTVIRCAPLVSIDLILRSPNNDVWLGLRKDEPARGNWFVPGGRIRKDETVADAFARIVKSELNIDKSIQDARFIGPFQHRYATNAYELPGVTTHYVVLAYELRLTEKLDATPDSHHSAKRWWPLSEILKSPDVHEFTAAYFKENPITAVHVGRGPQP
jgi:colanic acid biosynthesis protein WcaH